MNIGRFRKLTILKMLEVLKDIISNVWNLLIERKDLFIKTMVFAPWEHVSSPPRKMLPGCHFSIYHGTLQNRFVTKKKTCPPSGILTGGQVQGAPGAAVAPPLWRGCCHHGDRRLSLRPRLLIYIYIYIYICVSHYM